jgi:hypothetical protein
MYLFQVFAPLITSLFANLISTAKMSLFGVFLYAHFYAHFLIAKKQIPIWLPWIFFLVTIFITLINIGFGCFQHVQERVMLGIAPHVTNICWIVILSGIECWVYQDVNHLLHQTKPRALSWVNDPVHKGLEKVMMVHGCILLFNIVSFTLSTFFIVTLWRMEREEAPSTPTFSSYLDLSSFFLLWSVFTWWAWIGVVESSARKESLHVVIPQVSPSTYTPSPKFILNPLAIDVTGVTGGPSGTSLTCGASVTCVTCVINNTDARCESTEPTEPSEASKASERKDFLISIHKEAK